MTDPDKKGQFIANQADFIYSQGFDSVLILATLHNKDDKSTGVWHGSNGNVMAILGHVREWLWRQEEMIKAEDDRDV